MFLTPWFFTDVCISWSISSSFICLSVFSEGSLCSLKHSDVFIRFTQDGQVFVGEWLGCCVSVGHVVVDVGCVGGLDCFVAGEGWGVARRILREGRGVYAGMACSIWVGWFLTGEHLDNSVEFIFFPFCRVLLSTSTVFVQGFRYFLLSLLLLLLLLLAVICALLQLLLLTT